MWVKYVSTIVVHTFCLSMIKARLSCSRFLISSENCCQNYTHESLFSYSTTANANGKTLSFASLIVITSICPPNLPFRWQPSKPMIGLQPPKKSTFLCIIPNIHSLKFGLCIFIFHFSLQNSSTSFIIQSYHLYIILKLPILQLFIPSDQVSSFPFCPIHLTVTYVNFKCLLHMILNTSHFPIEIFVKLLHKLLCNIT